MTNPFLNGGHELVLAWRSLRDSLASKTDIEKLTAVADFFACAPLSKLSCDPDDPDTWGDAWEMIDQNDWCAVRVAVMMEATLRWGGMDEERLVLEWGIDREESRQEMLLVVDGTHVLNRELGAVMGYPRRQVLVEWHHTSTGFRPI